MSLDNNTEKRTLENVEDTSKPTKMAKVESGESEVATTATTAAPSTVATLSDIKSEKVDVHHGCRVGRAAPGFSVPAVLPDGAFGNVTLEQYKGRYLAIVFYPADFTFVCPTEIASFSDRAKEFADVGCDLVVCSTDSEYAHYNWRQQSRKDGGVGEVSVPMLADRTKEMARAYGVLCEETGQAFRGLFIIDKAQCVRVAMINDNPIGRSVDEALRLVEALQHTDTHGDVCPANWQKGKDTIRPIIEESKSFFAKAN